MATIAAPIREKKDCCNRPENLRSVPQGRPDLTIEVCAECGCRHFRVRPDKFTLIGKAQPIGQRPQES